MSNSLNSQLPQKLASLIIENAREYAIFTIGSDGFITSWNIGAQHIFGYAPTEAIGMHFSALFTQPDILAGVPQQEITKARDQGRAEDTRWHIRKNGEQFWANGITMLISDPDVDGLLKITRDETPTRRAEEQRVLLLNELNHRIKNTLATVQSIVDNTMRANNVDARTRRNLTERLIALSEAHDILVQESWAGADLETVVRNALAPYAQADREVFRLEGPSTRLSPRQAVAMALVLHELATNAVKYGALSSQAGLITLMWNHAIDGSGRRHLTLLWKESGGPPVTPPLPGQSGFGSRLINRSFGSESGGRARVEYAPSGVRCLIELELSTDAETPMLDLTAAAGRPGDDRNPRRRP